MSHANAALTPRARVRVARPVVEEGWPVGDGRCPLLVLLTHRQAVGRQVQGRPQPITDRSSRPRSCPHCHTQGGGQAGRLTAHAPRVRRPSSSRPAPGSRPRPSTASCAPPTSTACRPPTEPPARSCAATSAPTPVVSSMSASRRSATSLTVVDGATSVRAGARTTAPRQGP